MAEGVVQAEAAGITFGRNIWQSSDGPALVGALKQVLHEGRTAQDALASMGRGVRA